ncbi:hypothetical protein [Parafilimonas terrae]|uniref:Uncharacterized protein n=1 Tax=Parafilimonas terrae TaxID=1465490 RepID=A0A1I5WAP0_9BACT|nr:hypothetical protein [Parafilimonas terrae]SFQ16834.1 hypothetical protein SAMN05444277_10665 [Parafilimonas terrae]
MKTNPSEKSSTQNTERNVNDVKNKMQDLHGNAEDNSENYRKGKGTGMSSEAGSDQSERSWQDTGGSHANRSAENKDTNMAGHVEPGPKNSNTENLTMKEDKGQWSKKGDNG